MVVAKRYATFEDLEQVPDSCPSDTATDVSAQLRELLGKRR